MSILLIDDSDPLITWTGTWEREGDSFEFNNTCSGSKTAGATALVTFTGTNITVYGTLTHGISTSTLPLSLYTLDDGPVSGSFAPSRPTSNVYHQVFFASPALPYGTHTLQIQDATTTDTGLWLDYFIVGTAPDANTTSTSSQSSPSPSTESTGTTAKAHSDSWIIAVSLVVGGCVILSAMMLFIFISRRRRRKRSEVRVSQITEPFPLQPSFQDNNSSQEPPYRFSGMHRKAALSSSFSTVQTSYDPSTSDGSGSHISYLESEPPRYTEHRSP